MAEPEFGQDGAPSPKSDFARRTGFISLATLLSRLLGLVREQLLASTLGASLHADAYLIAYRIPNLLRDLFAEGALSVAFVPVYARARAEGEERAFDLTRRVLTLLSIALAITCCVAYFYVGEIVSALASGFDATPEKARLATSLARVMLPILPLVSFAAVAMGVLNARDRFGAPALAPAAFNVVNILVATILAVMGFSPVTIAYGWAIGAVLGSFAQFATQVPSLYREGFKMRLDGTFSDPYIAQIFKTMGPAMIGLAAVQINLFVSNRFASQTPSAVSWINYAFRILYLPMGLFGVAVGVVATSRLSKQLAEGRSQEAFAQVRQALRLLIVLTVPSAVGLMVTARPVVRLLYERGAFRETDTHATAMALAFMSIGLVAYASTKVFVPYFYAAQRPRVPVIATSLAVVANILVIEFGGPTLGFAAAALAMAVGNLVNGGVLLAVYSKTTRRVFDAQMWGHVLKVTLASALMGAVAHGLIRLIDSMWGGATLPLRAASALLPSLAGVICYAMTAQALGVTEVSDILARVFRRRPPAQ